MDGFDYYGHKIKLYLDAWEKEENLGPSSNTGQFGIAIFMTWKYRSRRILERLPEAIFPICEQCHILEFVSLSFSTAKNYLEFIYSIFSFICAYSNCETIGVYANETPAIQLRTGWAKSDLSEKA